MELVLALVLAVGVSSLGVVVMGTWRSDARFEEDVERFEATLRLARADACIQGRRIQLRFDASAEGEPGLSVYWEPRPLEDPGTFVPYTTCPFLDALPEDSLVVEAARSVGDSAYTTLLSEQLSGGEAVDADPVTFYPDGSCTSAAIVLAPASQDDTRRVVVHMLSSAEDFATYETIAGQEEEYLQAASLGESLSQLHRELHPPEEWVR